MDKPRIYALEGYLIATASKTLGEFEAKYEILEDTEISTSIGHVMIVKIVKAGNVLIAGPSDILGMQKIVQKLGNYSLNNIFIDGAFFRHTLAKVSDATIFVVGSSLSRDMDKVIMDAVATVKKFKLKTVQKDLDFLRNYDNVCLVNEQNKVVDLKIKSIILSPVKLVTENVETFKYVYIPRALSNDFVEQLIEERRDFKLDIIVRSPIHIQLNLGNMSNLFKLKNNIYVLDPINLQAICYNPTSPYGYEFDNFQFERKLEENLGMKVINVMEETTK